jgi:hypothetical protein
MDFGCDLLRCVSFLRDYLPPHWVSVWIISHHNQFQSRLSSTGANFSRNWLRTLFIAGWILAERTAPDCQSASPFVSVILEGPNVDFRLPLQYRTLPLKIVAKSQQSLKQPSDEAYWLCCSFITVQGHIQMPIARSVTFCSAPRKNSS